MKKNLLKSANLTKFFLSIIVISHLFTYQSNARLNEAQKTEITKKFLTDASINVKTSLKAKIISGELVNLTPNQKEYIKDHFPALCNSLSWIKKLELYNCNLESLPDEISKLKRLTILDLSHNKLQDLPIGFYKLSGLQSLNLSSNNINTLHEDIEGLKSITNLNLRDNQISTLPNNFVKLVQLKHIDLENNKIIDLPNEIGALKKLITLNVSYNKIVFLPDSFASLSNLKELYLQYNNIKTFPPHFEQLKTIEVINLYHNKIDFLPYSFEELFTLEELNLGHNYLKKLPKYIGQLTKLKHLTLEDNYELSTIPNSLLDLIDSLESLNLLRTNIPKNSNNEKLGRKKLQMLFEDRVVFYLEKKSKINKPLEYTSYEENNKIKLDNSDDLEDIVIKTMLNNLKNKKY